MIIHSFKHILSFKTPVLKRLASSPFCSLITFTSLLCALYSQTKTKSTVHLCSFDNSYIFLNASKHWALCAECLAVLSRFLLPCIYTVVQKTLSSYCSQPTLNPVKVKSLGAEALHWPGALGMSGKPKPPPLSRGNMLRWCTLRFLYSPSNPGPQSFRRMGTWQEWKQTRQRQWFSAPVVCRWTVAAVVWMMLSDPVAH